MEGFDKKLLKIHNYIYANDALSNTDVLDEFLKLFYCKMIDEQDKNNQLKKLYKEAELVKYIKDLYVELKKRMPDVFDKNDTINLKDRTIAFIVNELSEINFRKIKSDVKGHILQKIIDRSYREGKGQFFTPAPVVDFMVQMINPQKGELGCDPASGTGGFMFRALEHIARNSKITKDDCKNVYFFDISKNLIKLVLMRMMFEYSVKDCSAFVQDSLSGENNIKFDYIITNPPFGSQGRIDNKNILNKYELASDGDKKFASQAPDILFVEKVIKSLNKGGRAAIVLPDGDFENPSLRYFRKYLVNSVKLDAVISLPDGVFIPYGTGVKSSIVFFTKKDVQELADLQDDNYSVFYAKITKLGYTFSKHSKDVLTKSGEIDEDYTRVLTAYKNKKYDDRCYLVPIKDIISNGYLFSENFYSPIVVNFMNELKKKPYKTLKDVADFEYKKERIISDRMYRYIEIGDVNAYGCEIINCSDILGENLPSRASYIVHTNNIIVATSGNAIGTVKQAKAIINSSYDGCICTNGFTVVKPKLLSPYFLLNFFNSKEFRMQVLRYKYGSAIPSIGREDFEKIIVPIPSEAKVKQIECNIKRFYELREEALNLLKN